jgi:Putative transposase
VTAEVCKEITEYYQSDVSSQVLSAIGFANSCRQSEVGTGAISFMQFFGSALNLTPHLHIIFMDGGWVRDRVGFKFVPAINFNSEAMSSVIHGILRRLDALFKEFNYVREDGEGEEPELSEDVPLPFKPREPKAYRRRGRTPDYPLYKQTDPDTMSIEGWCNIKYKWFSLHAGVAIKADDWLGLKKLIRYTSRLAVSPTRLSYVDPDAPGTSAVRLTLKKTWTDGTSELILSQKGLTEKIAEIIPPSWFNLTRYHGVFFSRAYLERFYCARSPAQA